MKLHRLLTFLPVFSSFAMAFKKLDEQDIRDGFIDSFDYVLTDLDGVLWVRGKLLPKAAEIFSYFRNEGKKIIFMTNDDMAHRREKLKTFQEMGIEASMEEIFTASYCAALYVDSLGLDKKQKVYVIGMQGLVEEMSDLGYSCLPIGPEPVPDDYQRWVDDDTYYATENVSAVVVGFDIYISYPKLWRAMNYLERPEVAFIGTHTDARYPLSKGRQQPGAKGFIEAVSAVSGRSPVVTGKPSPDLLKSFQTVYPDLNTSRAIMIGDNLSTDILFGRKTSIQTMFVLTGLHTLNDVRKNQADPDRRLEVPDLYTESLESFFNLLTKETNSTHDV